MKEHIKCACCNKNIYEGDMCLEHEYGKKYCSYKCLVVHGFYGHYKLYELDKFTINEK